jgi:XTP/dITP diphosphohydrolase
MVTFVTGNDGKYEIARDIFSQYGVDLLQDTMDAPEIQSLSVEEVAKYSAEYAAHKLNKAVIKSDVGYYIPALNGFPGPFIKFINQYLTAEKILNLMSKETDRKLIIRECVVLAVPGRESKSFTHEHIAKISECADGSGSPIDQVMILDGFLNTRGASSEKDVVEYFKKSLKLYHEVAQYLKEQSI